MTGTTLRVDVMQLSLQFELFPAEAVIGVARDLDKRYNPTIVMIYKFPLSHNGDFPSRGVYFSGEKTSGIR